MAVDLTGGEEEVLRALARETDLAILARPNAAALILSGNGRRLFTSRAARELLSPRTRHENGGLHDSLPHDLRAFASRAEPGGGLRFERLRLNGSCFATPMTCACRTIALAFGGTGVLLVLGSASGGGLRRVAAAGSAAIELDPPSAGYRYPAPLRPAPEASGAALAEGDLAEAVPHLRGRGTVRFLWEADAEGRFTAASPALASVVGGSAAIKGRAWRELVGTVVVEDAGVNDLFARGQAWTGRSVRWRIAGTSAAVAVDLGGMPVLRPDRTVGGFRGFGLIRTDALTWWRSAGEPSSVGSVATPHTETVDGGTPSPAEASRDDPAAMPEACSSISAEAAAPLVSDPNEQRPSAGREADPAGLPSPADVGALDLSSGKDAAELIPRSGPSVAPRSEPDAIQADPSGEAARPAPPIPRLSHTERAAFRDIARALGARLDGDHAPGHGLEPFSSRETARVVAVPLRTPKPADRVRPALPLADAGAVLDLLPVGVLIHRGEEALFANRAFLELVGHDGAETIRAVGGISDLFEVGSEVSTRSDEEPTTVTIAIRGGGAVAAEVRTATVSWGGAPARCLTARRLPLAAADRHQPVSEWDGQEGDARARELSAILDTATDGVIVLDGDGRILSLNRSAEALFGYDRAEVEGGPLTALLAPESHATASAYLEGLRLNGVGSLLNDGREVAGRVRQGGAIPLFMTLGRLGEETGAKFCAVLRDVTALEKARAELASAKRGAETAIARRSDVLAKVSHELRTPLNAIIGFAEVMLEERFGPVGNERYRDYLQDIHGSGRRVVALVDDLLDLARIEAGRMELRFARLSLNELVAAAVAALQPQAARERIVVRTSFAPKLPAIAGDERSLRQIVRNLVSNAVKFTAAGGQVIVSTAVTDRGEIAFRVRDTGVGMTSDEIEAALEPFRTLATARPGGGTGLGLPLARALAEANRATLHVTSARHEGTLAEVLFPPAWVPAE